MESVPGFGNNRDPRLLGESKTSLIKMTIKHVEEISLDLLRDRSEIEITELGDNKVMKQNVDDAFIDVCVLFLLHM